MWEIEGSLAMVQLMTSSNHMGFLGEIIAQAANKAAEMAAGTSHSAGRTPAPERKSEWRSKGSRATAVVSLGMCEGWGDFITRAFE
jgi:hypothetical protein